MSGVASSILNPTGKPWQPTKRAQKRMLERARGRALQLAADWAKKDATFMHDLRRLTEKGKPGSYHPPAIARIGIEVEMRHRAGAKLDMRGGVKRSAFAAAAASLSGPYSSDRWPITPTQAKRAYYGRVAPRHH